MTATAVPALPPSETVELDSVEGLVQFKIAVTIAILVITVLSSLAPLWISQNGTSRAQQVLTKKLPFMTAGVFIGSGLLHLLPDAVKMYDKALRSSPTMLSAKWIQEYPLMYLLSALGCMIVWSVDLLNLGDSPKMMAVASAARPNHETSMCRVQIPRVASFGMRNRSFSSDALGQDRTRHACSCGDVSSPANKAFHHAATTEETKFLLSHNGVKVYSDSSNKPRTHSFEMANHSSSRLHVGSMPPVHLHAHGIAHDHGHPPSVSENDALVLDEKDIIMVDEPEEISSEATVSQHVVFSGESPLLPYLLAALFSIHSLIAGFALGVNSTSNKTAIATAVAIFSHKVIEAMSVGANFARAKDSIAQDRSVAVLTLYSFMTPVGIVLGMVLASELQGTAVLVVESVALSVASGSFVYLAFHEISDEHAAQDSTPIEKIALFGAGLFSMAALATWA